MLFLLNIILKFLYIHVIVPLFIEGNLFAGLIYPFIDEIKMIGNRKREIKLKVYVTI